MDYLGTKIGQLINKAMTGPDFDLAAEAAEEYAELGSETERLKELLTEAGIAHEEKD